MSSDGVGWEMSELLNKAKIIFSKRSKFGLAGRGGGKGRTGGVAEWVGFECGFQAECDLGQTLRSSGLLKEVDGSVLE